MERSPPGLRLSAVNVHFFAGREACAPYSGLTGFLQHARNGWLYAHPAPHLNMPDLQNRYWEQPSMTKSVKPAVRYSTPRFSTGG